MSKKEPGEGSRGLGQRIPAAAMLILSNAVLGHPGLSSSEGRNEQIRIRRLLACDPGGKGVVFTKVGKIRREPSWAGYWEHIKQSRPSALENHRPAVRIL